MGTQQPTSVNTELERLSDAVKLSAHVTRLLGQNPGVMTLQGTNSYVLQPPSNPLAPVILIDTSSPHTAQQYVDVLFNHLFNLALQSGTRETHFESEYANGFLSRTAGDKDALKAQVRAERAQNPLASETLWTEYGPTSKWSENATAERRLPAVEHIILTHRHLDHVGAVPTLLKALKEHNLPPPKIWKFPSPDEAELQANENDRPTTDASLIDILPQGTYHPFSPFQPLHPIIPGLMLSIIDPTYKHLLKHDKDGKPKWNEVPEIARVSVRCLRTPGHTADSVSLVMCEGEKGVFTGDTVLGQGTTVFTDLASYMTSLKTLLALKPNVLYPAHGPHLANAESSAAHIRGYISHRQEREDQIVALLQKCRSDAKKLGKIAAELLDKFKADAAAKEKYEHEYLSGRPWTLPREAKAKREKEEEERLVQDGRPEDRFGEIDCISAEMICRVLYQTDNEKIIWAARKSVGAHLVKLEKEGKVKKEVKLMPRILEGRLSKDEEQEAWGWEWDGEKVKVD